MTALSVHGAPAEAADGMPGAAVLLYDEGEENVRVIKAEVFTQYPDRVSSKPTIQLLFKLSNSHTLE